MLVCHTAGKTMEWCGFVFVVITFVILAPSLCGVLRGEDDTYLSVQRRSVLSDQQETQTVGSEAVSAGPYFQDVELCGPDESCAGRCGNPANQSESFRCFCDHRCTFYKDCCMDFEELCSGLVGINERETESLIGSSSGDSIAELPDRSGLKFDCVELEEFAGGTVWMESTCHPQWTDSRMALLCSDVYSGDTLSRLPVQGKDGFTYRNVYCAQCNFAIVDVIYWIGVSACYAEPPPDAGTNMASLAQYLRTSCQTLVDEPRMDDVTKPRFCLPNVNWCNMELAAKIGGEFLEFMKICQEGYQQLVRGQSDFGRSFIYKNPSCALCNGIQRNKISCGVPAITRFSDDVSYYDFFADARTAKIRSSQRLRGDPSKPPFLVVTNYNFRTSASVMILRTDGSDGVVPVEITCPETEVYDPYLGECRPTYCSEGYIMSQSQCVREKMKEVKHTESYSVNNDSIQMVLSITVKFKWFAKDSVRKQKQPAPAPFIPLNGTWSNATRHPGSRIKVKSYIVTRTNLTLRMSEVIMFSGILNHDKQNVTLDRATQFWLSLFSFDVQGLQMNIYGNVFNVDLDVVERFINSLRGNAGQLASFVESCPDGVKNVYPAGDLVVNGDQSKNECLDVYIKNTNISYECRSLLFLNQMYGSNDDPNQEQFSTVVACEGDSVTLDQDCVRISYMPSECQIENSTVVCTNGKRYGPGEFESALDGKIFVCSDLDVVIETKNVVQFNFTKAQDIIAICGVVLSTACLSATLITYAMFKELRTLPGMNLMTLAVILLINNWAFLFGLFATTNHTVCVAVSIFLHLICLFQFCWVNVIAYDVYKTFGRKRLTKIHLNVSPLKQYLKYALYALGLPVAIVSVSVALDFCECTPLDVDYGMYFNCWISDPIAYAVFFGAPMALTNGANIVLFVVTVCNLRRYHRNSAVISGNTHSHFTPCAKLATVMGFAWNFAFVASIFHNPILWYFFFVFYFLQGVFMFISYIFNRRVYRMYLKRFGHKRLFCTKSQKSVPCHSSATPQVPDVHNSPRPALPTTGRSEQHLPNQPTSTYLPADNIKRQTQRPTSRRSNSCSLAHVSSNDNFVLATRSPFNARGRWRRGSFTDGIRHLRTSSVDGFILNSSTSTTSGSPQILKTPPGVPDPGKANPSYSSDKYSSCEDDVFQPAYHITQC